MTNRVNEFPTNTCLSKQKRMHTAFRKKFVRKFIFRDGLTYKLVE